MSLDVPLRPAPGSRSLPIVGTREPAPRHVRHRALGAVVAAYLLVALLTVPVAELAPLHGWIALHLLLLGAATNAVFVFSRHFAQALLHSRGGSERWATVRLAVLNAGVVAVLLGVSLPAEPLLATGGALVVAAVLAHVASLLRMQRAALLAGRLRVVVRYYVAAGLALAAGGVLGALLGLGVGGGSDLHTSMYLAHVHLNLLGWVGLTVLGTSFMLWPAVLRTRMADDAPRVARSVLVLSATAVAVTAGGFLAGSRPAAALGLGAAAAAVLWSFVPVLRIARRKPPRTSAAVHLAAASGWLLVALLLDAVATASSLDGALRIAGTLVPVLALGFVAQVLVAALTFLLPVLVGGGPAGNRRLTALLETGWTARALVGNLGVLLLVLPLPDPAGSFGWALAVVGLGAFVPLMVTALVVSRRVPQEAAPAGRPALVPALGLLTVVALLGLVGTGTWPASAPAPAAATADALVVQVALSEMKVEPSVVTVPAGRALVLEVRNAGAMRHDLRMDGGRSTPMLGPGESARLDAGVIPEDTTAWCTVGGHRQAGMVLQVVVTAAGPAVAADGHDHAAAPQPETAPAPEVVPYDPFLKPVAGGRVHDVTLRVTETELVVAPDVRQTMWTFDGTVPGPVLRGRVGDLFHVTLVNGGTLPHSIDFHASRVAPDRAMRSIEPGEELLYSFRAERAGAWLYHCGTTPVLQHVAMGMYGAVVIDPPDLAPVDHELLLVQSDLYLGPDGDLPDMEPMRRADHDLVAFNGQAGQYDRAPIRVPAGERVRAWVLAAGPSASSAFHVVGTTFDTVYKEGAYLLQPADAGGSQALDLAPSQGGFVEFVLPEPGRYPIVSHRLADAALGAAGAFLAE